MGHQTHFLDLWSPMFINKISKHILSLLDGDNVINMNGANLRNYRGFQDRGSITISKNYSGFYGTGKEFEDEVLYRVPWHIDANRMGFLPKHEAISRVRANQPEIEGENGEKERWNPAYPPIVKSRNGESNSLAQDTQACVCDELGMEDYSNMRLYTALGSSLDVHHGADAFLEFDDPDCGHQLITLDFTKDPIKYLNGHKADVIVFGKHPEVAARDVAEVLEKRRLVYGCI